MLPPAADLEVVEMGQDIHAFVGVDMLYFGKDS